jgi:hypothetical protein
MAKDRIAHQPPKTGDSHVTSQSDPGETPWHAGDGAIPPTGGVPPEDAPPAGGYAPHDRATPDDLVEVIDLLLRGARKGLGGVDPELEAQAERALLRLQQLDTTRLEILDQADGTDRAELEKLTQDVARELAATVERIVARVEAAFSSQSGH